MREERLIINDRFLKSTNKKRVLITGSMRSGTTFLANVINTDENSVVLRDSLLSIFRVSRKIGIKSFIEILSEQKKNVLLSNLKNERFVVGLDKINNIRNEQFVNLEQLFIIMTDLISNDKTKIVGVKVTEAEGWIDTIIKETDIKIIYLVRDLRDVLLSSKNRFIYYNKTIFSKRWKYGVTKAFENRNNNLLFIKFEDFIQKPIIVINEISLFLDHKIDFKDKKLKDILNNNWIENSSFNDITKTFDKKVLFRWKNYLSSKDVIYGSVINKKLMIKLGYEENKINFFYSFYLKIVHNLPFLRIRRFIASKW